MSNKTKTGRRGIAEWGEIFSPLIHFKPYEVTTPQERIFVHFHIHRYQEYRKKITDYIFNPRGAMAGREVRGNQYEAVFKWYKDRIPFYIVREGIDESHQYARSVPKRINSILYFDRAVRRYLEQFQSSPHRVGSPDYSQGGKDPFYFHAWQAWERGGYGDAAFCGVIGPNWEGQGIKR